MERYKGFAAMVYFLGGGRHWGYQFTLGVGANGARGGAGIRELEGSGPMNRGKEHW